jgi:hypothetical protein
MRLCRHGLFHKIQPHHRQRVAHNMQAKAGNAYLLVGLFGYAQLRVGCNGPAVIKRQVASTRNVTNIRQRVVFWVRIQDTARWCGIIDRQISRRFGGAPYCFDLSVEFRDLLAGSSLPARRKRPLLVEFTKLPCDLLLLLTQSVDDALCYVVFVTVVALIAYPFFADRSFVFGGRFSC